MKLGKYRHFKGMMYEVLGIVKHSETLEDYVHYRALYDNEVSKEWIRPLKMFQEQVTMPDGEVANRFDRISK
jgi:cyclomaltodextrinase / maltogenic alpha-amylase / neopullulanase